jgi:hypothetical protein
VEDAAIKYCISDIYHCLYIYIYVYPTFTGVISRTAHHIYVNGSSDVNDYRFFFFSVQMSRNSCVELLFIPFTVGLYVNALTRYLNVRYFFRNHPIFRLVYHNWCTHIGCYSHRYSCYKNYTRFDYYALYTTIL